MFGNHHSTTSTPMSDMARNVFIIGKYHFGKSHCSIGTLIKSSYSTHNIISFRLKLERVNPSPSLISYQLLTRMSSFFQINFHVVKTFQSIDILQLQKKTQYFIGSNYIFTKDAGNSLLFIFYSISIHIIKK